MSRALAEQSSVTRREVDECVTTRQSKESKVCSNASNVKHFSPLRITHSDMHPSEGSRYPTSGRGCARAADAQQHGSL
eukprot:1156636-Pelagomonas_calceolata.AAC.1